MRQKKKRIRWVDGFRVRNSYPDFDLVESDATSGDWRDGHVSPYIPKGEIWIDRRFRSEKAFLLKVHAFENKRRNRPYDEVRDEMKRRLCRHGTPPPYEVRRERRQGLTVIYVRGDIVRQWIDPAFIFGGHDLIYPYIPRGEVWIDIRQDPREIRFTLGHELHEREKMRRLLRRGIDRKKAYAIAHKSATDIERELRNRKPRAAGLRPLKVKVIAQTAGYCGPASLKVASEHFGRIYKERHLERLCRRTSGRRVPTRKYGTDHAELVAVAKALGGFGESKTRGTLADISRNLRLGRPVIVGWTTPDGDHFSVVYFITRTHVFMSDPDEGGSRRKMRVGRFLRAWKDTDTPENVKVERWYLAIDFREAP